MGVVYHYPFDNVYNSKPPYARFEFEYSCGNDEDYDTEVDERVMAVQGVYDRCVSDDYVHIWVKILKGDNAGDETDGWMPITWYKDTTEYGNDGLACEIDGLPNVINGDSYDVFGNPAFIPIVVTPIPT